MLSSKNNYCLECDGDIDIDLPVLTCTRCAFANLYAESDINREITKLFEAGLKSHSE